MKIESRPPLPSDIPLLTSINLLFVRIPLPQQHFLYLPVQKLLSLRIPRIQTVVIDQQGLVLQPLRPALGADLPLNALPQVGTKRSSHQLRLVRPAPSTVYGFHGGFGPPV